VKITGVRVREVSIPRIYETHVADRRTDALFEPDHSRYQIIELQTDAGITGVGEISDIAKRMDAPAASDTSDLLGEALIGADVDRWRPHYDRVAELMPPDCHPELRGLTLFGVEIACLDLTGQRYGVPVYELLGGRCRGRVQVCWVAYLRGDISKTDELGLLETEVRGKLSEGFTAFKFKVGVDHQRDIERVKLFRELTGRDVYLRVDASGVWEEDEAVEKMADLAAAGIDACESPILAVNRSVANDNPRQIDANSNAVARALAGVRRRVRDRVGGGVDIIEHVADLDDCFCAALVAHKAVDVINVIPSQGGGLLRARRLVHAAQTAGVAALLGSTIELGPGTAAFVHLAVAARNITVSSDLVGPGLLVGDICEQPLRFLAGHLQPPEGDGLGRRLSEARMEEWAI